MALALSKAQGALGNAHKDKDNPFFKSKYADLAACWDACREPLSKNELAVVQTHKMSDKGDMILITRLIHSSGQYIKGILNIRPVKNDPQMYVSATTYGRRAALSAIVGISPSEDDGNEISGKTTTKPLVKTKTPNKTNKQDKPKEKIDTNGDDEF